MGESFFLSQSLTKKMRYVWTKSDHWGLSYEPAKFVRISARVSRALLARGLSWTLNMRSFSHTDRILLPHISFFASGPNLEKSSLPFFTENFSSSWKVTSTETDILSNFLNLSSWEVTKLQPYLPTNCLLCTRFICALSTNLARVARERKFPIFFRFRKRGGKWSKKILSEKWQRAFL